MVPPWFAGALQRRPSTGDVDSSVLPDNEGNGAAYHGPATAASVRGSEVMSDGVRRRIPAPRLSVPESVHPTGPHHSLCGIDEYCTEIAVMERCQQFARINKVLGNPQGTFCW